MLEQQRQLRAKIVQEAEDFDFGFLAKVLLKKGEQDFVYQLVELCRSRRQVRSEVIQSLLELRGGLSPYFAERLLANLEDLTRDTYVMERGKPLVLLPPNTELAEKDLLLYERSRQLCAYVDKGPAGVLTFQEQFAQPEVMRAGI